jgi:glycosyltransferase involved in cell wall biosynthesis
MGANLHIAGITPSSSIRILADTGYAAMLPDCDNLQNEIQRRFGKWVARLARFSSVRGVLGWWIGRKYDFLVTVSHWQGGRWLVFLTAWLGGSRRRKIILLEFISCPERLLNRMAYSVWLPLIFRPAIRRTMLAAQVMTAAEPGYYSKLFGIPASLFHVIPLPLIDDNTQDRAYSASEDTVLSSGRAACDWETLFHAAQGANWNLCVICSKHDRKHVDSLNRDRRAIVLSEVSPEEHARMMARAAVYVLPLRHRPISIGQLRMRNAISAGTPIVCTRVEGLSGYAVHQRTASLIDEGDEAALRREVDKLLYDLEWRRTLATRAREFASTRTAACFSGTINDFVCRVVTDTRAKAPSLVLAPNAIKPSRKIEP